MLKRLAFLASAGLALAAASAGATDLAKNRATLPDLVLGDKNGDDYAVSQKDYELEAGKSYQLDIVSNGGKEYKFFSPELFRHIWINQIVINHLEIHGPGAPHHLEWDDEGAIRIEFVVIRPGNFKWWIDGLEEKGMSGTFKVKS
ncbi:hypothetical protein GCM10008171_03790 [Methylopila jiangsuensis]|uniref:Copper-binding protein n=1 Tax=Methylopila jiangsuensis TaxID=586230 RepID=A0A9W6JFW2_9HYPH|nr:hypothetical protein [Methylopila jiangsuensis]MDR6285369.1 putative cupredoxin-like copper-binding protein [Methylopila jiangsuensis]GLK75125.1 hypothetical protein GCM10008171_03790 [Methylopila jiangsuensis]